MRIPKNLLSENGTRAPIPSEASDRAITAIGNPPWNPADPVSALDEFLPIFERRPIIDNQGGMRSVGLFNVWFLLNRLRPTAVLESGIWKGQSTWLIEQTLPDAAVFSLDINLGLRQYISPRVRYSQTDFLHLDLPGFGFHPEGALAFFDDHQDVHPRLVKCRQLGIKHIILDDNYPEFAGARHISAAAILNDRNPDGAVKYASERNWLLENIDTYFLCKPIFEYLEPLTMEKSYIKESPLLGRFDPLRHGNYAAYHRDMPEYRWTTYLKLK